MTDRPLAERQKAIVRWLAENGGSHPPSRIAYGIGMDKLPSITAYKGWSGTAMMNPAQRIISSLNGLRKRGLVYAGGRSDGMSGSAYGLTNAGLHFAAELRRENR